VVAEAERPTARASEPEPAPPAAAKRTKAAPAKKSAPVPAPRKAAAKPESKPTPAAEPAPAAKPQKGVIVRETPF
jgi:hypothetical protein